MTAKAREARSLPNNNIMGHSELLELLTYMLVFLRRIIKDEIFKM